MNITPEKTEYMWEKGIEVKDDGRISVLCN